MNLRCYIAIVVIAACPFAGAWIQRRTMRREVIDEAEQITRS